MPFGDLTEAHPAGAVLPDGGMIQFERGTSDMPAFEPGSPHAGAHPLNDQIAFQFGNGADDDDDGPAQRATGVDILPEADVFDPQVIEFIQDI